MIPLGILKCRFKLGFYVFFENELFYINREDCGLEFEDSSQLDVEVALVSADISRDLDDCFEVDFHKIEALIQKHEGPMRINCGYLDATQILKKRSQREDTRGFN